LAYTPVAPASLALIVANWSNVVRVLQNNLICEEWSRIFIVPLSRMQVFCSCRLGIRGLAMR